MLIPVSKSSVVFEKVLAPLQESFLYGASKEAFRYPSAFLFNNSILQEKVSGCYGCLFFLHFENGHGFHVMVD